MSTFVWLAPLTAFLGPMPPMRPERSRRPAGNEWTAAFVIGALVLVMVLPMVTIWGFYRPDQTFRARCEAQGGTVAFTSLSGDGPRRCVLPR